MRILFVYQHLTYGGVESVLLNRYKGLKRLDPSIEIEALFLYKLVDPRVQLADRVHVTSDPDELARMFGAADVVSVIDTPQVFEVAERVGRPTVVEVHSPYVDGRAYIREALPASTKLVLVPSRAFEEVVAGEIADKRPPLAHQHNPLDMSYFEPIRSGLLPPMQFAGARPVLWVGRLDELKDWERAVRIAAQLQERGRVDFELLMVGHNPEPGRVFEVFRSRKVLGRVRYLPAVDFAAMPSLYARVAEAGGVHLSTSRGESFGMTLAEAMAVGLPCVLHRLAPFEEVAGGTAAFFKTDGEAVSALERALSVPDAERERQRQALREVARRYHPDVIAKQLYDKFAQIVR